MVKVVIKFDDLVLSGGTHRMDWSVMRGGREISFGYWYSRKELEALRDAIDSYLRTPDSRRI